MNENTTDESSRALAEQHGALSISTNNQTSDNQFVITRCRRYLLLYSHYGKLKNLS